MRRRRALVVVLALAIGGLAGGAAYLYLQGVQVRAYDGAHLVDVYVANGTIPRGTTGADAIGSGLIQSTKMPLRLRPPGAVTTLASIRDAVAVTDIPPQQVIVAGLFAQPATQAGAAAQLIPKGDVAITISTDAVHGVAGLVEPGDHVDLLVQLDDGAKEAFLYQEVPVLAVGSALAEPAVHTTSAQAASPGSQAPATELVTFAVPPAAAARIAMAESDAGGISGSIYLALDPPGGVPAAVPPVSSASVLPPGLTPR
ncbi:MAG TPA: Flp pilus assembly protein CpaB [Acidimicrobiales bacterium]|nr:Flp pilus assembly protein CpaB [Acidimicrobiales bacterium]